MIRLRFLATALAAVLFIPTPASALTLEQAQTELAGMSCAGSTCTSTSNGTRTETVEGSEVRVVGHRGAAVGSMIESGKSSTCFFGNGWPMINVNPQTCSGQSLLLDGGGPIKKTFTTYTDVTINTLTTVTKELIYNGPNTDRAGAWTVNTTTETVDLP